MSEPEIILRFEAVSLPEGPEHDGGLRGISLRLAAGEVAFVRAAPARRLPLLDAAMGLCDEEQGAIEFCGQAWSQRNPDDAASARLRIGRTFHGPAWISNLDVDENITLKLRHHTGRPPEEIRGEAAALGPRFGFPELPQKRPAWMGQGELRRAQWIRALLGNPDLLLLEYPELGIAPEHVAALESAVAESAARGAAVLWLTDRGELPQDDRLKAARKYRILGDQWAD